MLIRNYLSTPKGKKIFMRASLVIAVFLSSVVWVLPRGVGFPNLGIRGIYKFSSVYMSDRMESTPIVFGGSLYSIVNKRSHRGSWTSSEILINKMNGRQKISNVPIPGIGLISAFVENGKVHVFGTTYAAGQSEVKMLTSTDLIHWSPPETVMVAVPGQQIYNTSVTRGRDGFVMAYEVAEKGIVGFTPRFARSDDLKSWSSLGDAFDKKRYAACPTIKYFDGWYYILYLSIVEDKFVTVTAKSQDLVHWLHGTKPAFFPQKGEGKNTSDVDMVQNFGITHFLYAVGDQQDWVEMKRAIYFGTEAQFFGQFKYVGTRL